MIFQCIAINLIFIICYQQIASLIIAFCECSLILFGRSSYTVFFFQVPRHGWWIVCH